MAKKSKYVEILNHQVIYQWVWLSGPTFINSFASANSKTHKSHPFSKPLFVWLVLTEVRRLVSAQKHLEQLVQLLSAHAGNPDWAKMSLGKGPTLQRDT